MSFADKYIRRLDSEGTSFKEQFVNHSRNINADKIINSPTNNGIYLGLTDNVPYYCMTKDVNGIKERKFIFTYGTPVEIGVYVRNGELTYLLTSKYTNEITPTFLGKRCTAMFPIIEEGRSYEDGYDDRGRPIIKYEEGTSELLPCIVKMNDASTSIASTNEAVNLLDNQVMVTIPYRESPAIQYNKQFELYNDNYRIIRINPADSINGVGILHITGERVESVGDK